MQASLCINEQGRQEAWLLDCTASPNKVLRGGGAYGFALGEALACLGTSIDRHGAGYRVDGRTEHMRRHLGLVQEQSGRIAAQAANIFESWPLGRVLLRREVSEALRSMCGPDMQSGQLRNEAFMAGLVYPLASLACRDGLVVYCNQEPHWLKTDRSAEVSGYL